MYVYCLYCNINFPIVEDRGTNPRSTKPIKWVFAAIGLRNGSVGLVQRSVGLVQSRYHHHHLTKKELFPTTY
jgi:hypothetical protein